MAELLCEKCGDPMIPSAELGRSCPRCLLSLAMPEEELEPASVSLPLGTMIGRYRIVRLIGEGGMGVVYEAEQEHPRRTVALKIIKPGFASLELLRRFEHESVALGRLQHPGIAQIYEAGTADTGYGPQPYFAMEFIHGETLRDYAEKHRLSTRGRLEIIVKVCDAVHHAHQRGLIHRDLKPGNILVGHDGQPKVLDFGVARLTNCDTQTTLQTVTGRIVGTLAYMSPEQALADPLELDTRSDVYSLGVILYELLSARLPYTIGKQIYEALEAIRAEDPARLSSIDRSYRGDIETIVAKALEKDKSRRYSSAAELAADVQRHLSDEPIVARPPSAAYQLKKFARRHKALVSGVAAVFVVLAAAVVVISQIALDNARQRDSALQAKKDAADQRERADLARGVAERSADEAQRATQTAEALKLEAELAGIRTARDRDRAILMSLVRESARVAASRTDDELAALLARQAYLIHSRTPGQPRSLVEEALQRVARLIAWSRVTGLEGADTPLAVVFPRDGARVASGRADFTLRAWDLEGPFAPRRSTIVTGQATVNAIAFSPDGALFAAGRQDGTVEVHYGDRPHMSLKASNPVSALAFSPDRTRLALATSQGAWVADLRNPSLPARGLNPFPGAFLSFASIAFSSDDVHVAGGTTRGDLVVFNLRDQSYRLIRSHTDSVTAVAFSPDGTKLASAGQDLNPGEQPPEWSIRVWDTANIGLPPTLLRSQGSQANAVAFSPDGKRLVSVGKDGGLRFWNLSDDGRRPQFVQAHVGAANSVAFSPDGERLVTAGQDHVVRIWNLRAGTPIELRRARMGQYAPINSLAFSPDNAYLVSGGADRTARVWNLRNLSAPPVLLPHEEAVIPALPGPFPGQDFVRPIVFSFSADSSRLATATFGAVRLWEMRDLASQKALFRNEGIQTLASLPDEAALASMAIGNGVVLPAVKQRGPVLSLLQSEPPAVKQWDLRSGVSQQIRADLVVFSDDLRLVASPQSDNSIRVWDLRRRNVPPVRLAGHRGYVIAVAFSHDGARLASVGRDLAVRVWDLKKPDAPLFEFQGDLRAGGERGSFVEFSQDNTRLVAGGPAARDVLLWDLLEPDSPPLIFNSPTAIRSVALSRDGTYLALGGVDGDVWLHRLWSGAADSLCTRISRNLSFQEWRYYVGDSIPYERTCPGLPAGTRASTGKP